MRRQPRPPLARPLVAGLLLLALGLPILVACGGAASSGIAPIPSPAAPQAIRVPAATAAAASGATSSESAAQPAAEAGGAPASGEAVLPAASGASDAAAPGGEMRAAPAATIGPPEHIDGPPPISGREQNNQQQAPLKAGGVDDNADFAAYLEYLHTFYSPPGRSVDVSERTILTVLNEQQQPVLDARVRVFDRDRQVFEGRTFAGGTTILLPQTLGLPDEWQSLRVVVEKGNSSAEGTLQRGQEQGQTITLQGAQAIPEPLRLDVMFLLDATGSMGDEIGQIQNTILSIAERIDRFSPRPELRFGLVAYRDRGDDYVTRVYDFTPDTEAFRQLLLSVRAEGGGDEPESLNEGLHAAIQRVSWADDAVRLTFLVADAPPHLDYANDYDYVHEARVAVSKGVKIYPIAASNSSDAAEYVFRQLAQQTLAQFIFLTYQPGQEAGPPGDSTTHHVDPATFSVERLDDLVVQVVQRELSRAVGAS